MNKENSVVQYDMKFPLEHKESRKDVENALNKIRDRLAGLVIALCDKNIEEIQETREKNYAGTILLRRFENTKKYVSGWDLSGVCLELETMIQISTNVKMPTWKEK